MAMRNDLRLMMERDIDATAADWSEVLTHIGSGQTITGTFSPVDQTRDIEPDGILQTADAEHVSKLSLWTTLPADGENVRIAGATYYIASQIRDPAAITLRLRVN